MSEITVLVPSYHPDREALFRTIHSILRQKNVDFEIVVCDDGSENNLFPELEALFLSEAFSSFRLCGTEVNGGTCRNIKRGMEYVGSPYVKLLAPGDELAGDTSLSDWLSYTKESGSTLTFGKIDYFRFEKGERVTVKVPRAPRNLRIYEEERKNQKSIMLNYIFLRDAIPGCDFISKTDVFREYLNHLLSIEQVRFAEDMTYRMMLIDGESISFFPETVVYYEYGNGISTSSSEKWKAIIDAENLAVNRYMILNCRLKGFSKFRFQLCMKAFCSRHVQFLKYAVYPELIYWKIRKNAIE